jgi:antitoxin CcdA
MLRTHVPRALQANLSSNIEWKLELSPCRMVTHAHNMRIQPIQNGFTMQATASSARKRPVNLTLSEGLVAQAKVYTSNLSATMESLLAEFVASQQKAQLSRRQMADACAADWNAVHAAVGSFADEHSTL